ncbi:MAG: prepilin-type N-terminal cleavage/methylation domain-containing protein, partial [Planctomycetes bacterium]|nr:prepilin-type N-terminal cleavage/methylation domain-containing protein [Planctomycetota bacterium]
MMKSSSDKKGFTLLEVMVASVIGAFIALVSVGALRAVTAGRTMVNTNIAAADELRYAVELIRSDLANVYRDGSADAMKFVGTFADTDDNMMTSLTMRIVSIANTRRSEPEGDIHEVQYYLAESEDKSVLMRRLYPIVGTEAEEELPGGVLTAIAENIVGFELMYFDGEEWIPEWPAELNSLPQMVEIVLATAEEKQGRQGSLVARKILAAFPRLPEQAQGTGTSGQGQAESGGRTTEAGQNTGSSGQSGGGSS